MNFLAGLNPDELDAFMSLSRERTFARGSRPIREGDEADYVMVILSGWVQISASENGRERVIAKRGPGQLVGEAGALRVKVRSATVTALDTVEARVMTTADFADFLGDHQQIREIVESQVDDWPAEEPYRHDERLRTFPPPQPPLSGENCTVIFTDIVGFGAPERTARDRLTVRTAHLEILRTSLGYLWDKCIPEDQGDGLLIVVPPATPTAVIMERLHQHLPGALRAHNHSHRGPSRIRLRLAATVGPVMSDPAGVTGEALIRAARLLDAPVLRDAMASPDASLGIIISTFIHETTVKHAEGGAEPDSYQAVEAHVKESRVRAWMRIFPQSPPALGSRGPVTATVL